MKTNQLFKIVLLILAVFGLYLISDNLTIKELVGIFLLMVYVRGPSALLYKVLQEEQNNVRTL